jgi:hypothetical protein
MPAFTVLTVTPSPIPPAPNNHPLELAEYASVTSREPKIQIGQLSPLCGA